MYCTASLNACEYFKSINPSYLIFKDLFEDFPVHLHINAHPSTQGQGLGSELIDFLITQIPHLKGVHLITAPTARNVSFYQKNHFHYSEERTYKDTPLLFLGRRL